MVLIISFPLAAGARLYRQLWGKALKSARCYHLEASLTPDHPLSGGEWQVWRLQNQDELLEKELYWAGITAHRVQKGTQEVLLMKSNWDVASSGHLPQLHPSKGQGTPTISLKATVVC